MSAATDFASLHEGSMAYSASRSGAVADAAYWRTLADERAAELRTAAGTLAQSARQMISLALGIIRLQAEMAVLKPPAAQPGMLRATLEIDGDEFVCEYDPETLEIDAVYIGAMSAGPYLAAGVHCSLRSLLEQHVEDAAEEAKQDAQELAAEARRETNKEL